MASVEYELDQFKGDYLIAWEVTTQCANQASVQLVGDDQAFFSYNKTTSIQSLQLLGTGNKAFTTAQPLKLKINVPQSREIKESIVSGAILSDTAKKVGYIYNFCFEDAGDRDYNDIYVNIVGWQNLARK